jgi:hypothetical protein
VRERRGETLEREDSVRVLGLGIWVGTGLGSGSGSGTVYSSFTMFVSV